MDDSADPREALIALLPRLRRFAGALTRDSADADDLVQVTVERALGRLHTWRREARLDSWMLGIMKNAWIDELRKRKRRGETAPANAAEGLPADEEDPAEMTVRVMSIEQGMARLPDEQRLAVALVLVDGLSYSEAAEVMRVPIGTLTSRLARGRTALEAMMTDHTPAAGAAQ